MPTDLIDLLSDQRLRVIDVGARGNLGINFSQVAKNTEIIGFEPELAEYERLKETHTKTPWASQEILPHAIGYSTQKREFYVARKPALSSLLPANMSILDEGWETISIIQMDTISLDDLFESGKLSGRYDFLKTDVQGADLEVIKSGAEHIVPSLLGILAETSFREHYLGQPLFSEVDYYLRDQGFELLALDISHGPPAAMSPSANYIPQARRRVDWCDALFLRGKNWIGAISDQVERAKVLRRLVVIYLLFGLIDEALYLCEGIDTGLREQIERHYESRNFESLRWRLGLLKRSVVCAFRPTRLNKVRLARHAASVGDTRSGHTWRLIHWNG